MPYIFSQLPKNINFNFTILLKRLETQCFAKLFKNKFFMLLHCWTMIMNMRMNEPAAVNFTLKCGVWVRQPNLERRIGRFRERQILKYS